ncbi:hypothetical protein RvY_02225-2 [Ramazzottius varieornatus]|uniref:Beta-1,4-mannosyl-glycoprotein 4-beta-N-acetylglucosaminyltransferase n=1 Tax=Ramazzottius varieornatus TaxID=947166 RepID=A0A1D1UMD4_RAMVA|nr:hypothetical protein RvY_02225-2 [Ramazzottius varieornatus]
MSLPLKRRLHLILHVSRNHFFHTRGKRKACTVLFAAMLLMLVLALNFRDFGYLTRPIWDTPPVPFSISPHFDHPSIPISELCSLHGWKPRKENSTVRVFDATIFSFEDDLLEIRLHELWDVVDRFIIVEADKTFTGKPKPVRFPGLRKNKDFSWAESKLLYKEVTLKSPNEAKNVSLAHLAWRNEARMRKQLTSLLTSNGLKAGDLVIQSDMDELPFQRTIALFRACEGYPDLMHLEMRTFMYSFEFPRMGPGDAKTSIKTKRDNDEWYYSHQRKSDHVLADAGWHCSFCFRHLEDFRTKMLGYSHFDRVTKSKFLDDTEIQERICAGKDLFDMFPEVYTFRDLVYQFWRHPPRSSSFIQIPTWILQNARRFAFLLPGGCIR